MSAQAEVTAICSAINYTRGLLDYDSARAAVERVGPGSMAEDPGYESGISANKRAMQSVAWGLVTGDWAVYLSICRMLRDPRYGIGAGETMGPLYRQDWSMGAHLAAYVWGPDASHETLSTATHSIADLANAVAGHGVVLYAADHLRAWTAMALLGTVPRRSLSGRVIMADREEPWSTVRSDLPVCHVSAAARGLMSDSREGNAGFWGLQSAVQALHLLINGQQLNPLAWDPAPIERCYVDWPIRLRQLDEVRNACTSLLTADEKHRARQWLKGDRSDPSVIIDLAAEVPAGPGGFHAAFNANGESLTWLDADPHGTKPAVMATRVSETFRGPWEADLFSPVYWRSDAHTRGRMTVTHTDEQLTLTLSGDCEQVVALRNPTLRIDWLDHGPVVCGEETPTPIPQPEETMNREETEAVLRTVRRALRGADQVDEETTDQPAQRTLRRQVKRPLRRAEEKLEEALDGTA